MNLLLQCGLGIQGITAIGSLNKKTVFIKLGIVFFAIIILWVIFAKIISLMITGVFLYVMLFPISIIVHDGLEFLVSLYLQKKLTKECPVSFSYGITPAALFICLNIANNFIEVVFLSFGFTVGTLLVFFILEEISRRAALEAVPRFLRGKPLTIISMGLLSLIFSTASILLFRMITEAG
jgi:electron transport complex protein RnfA